MADMSPRKVPMPEQDPKIRSTNFSEVSLGYTEEMAIAEAKRCLNCKHRPCVSGCPVNVNIPDFIMKVVDGEFEEAFRLIRETNCLPAVCGRVCPQESQCEERCVRAIKGESVGIGRLERFVADRHMATTTTKPEKPQPNGHRVAVIGAGPAGLTCAGDLAAQGFAVTVFEAFHKPGGVLVYGIPEFRLPKDLVAREIENVTALGAEIRTNMVIGKVWSIDELFEEGYEAVFIGSGAGLPSFMNIEGESLVGVYSANEYLTRANLMKAYDASYDTPLRKSRSVTVVGGGNVAMDAARTAKRLGAENVYIVYRRSEAEMPARLEEVHHAKEEGIIFRTLSNPIRILGSDAGEVTGIECVEMDLGEPDESGRRRPVVKKDSNFILDTDTVIISIGTSPNPLLRSTTEGLQTDRRGCLVVDENLMTTRPGVFAGGDAVTGAATVILAMGAGKKAAEGITKYLGVK